MTNLLPHPGKQLLFALLSLADLVLTWWLLRRADGHFYEANPLARWLLDQHGWAGLVVFKVWVVLLVFGLTLIIAGRRPHLSGRILGLGCTVLAVVVLYSASLAQAAASRSPQEQRRLIDRAARKHLEQINREAREAIRHNLAFRALLDQLQTEIVAGRCTLRQAVDQLAASEKASDPVWLRGLATSFPDRSLQERLAGCLLVHLVGTVGATDPRAARKLASDLEQEFRETFHTEPPQQHRSLLPGPRQFSPPVPPYPFPRFGVPFWPPRPPQ